MRNINNTCIRQTEINPVDIEAAVSFPQFTIDELQLHHLSVDDGVRSARVDRQLRVVRLRRQAVVHQPRRVPARHTHVTTCRAALTIRGGGIPT